MSSPIYTQLYLERGFKFADHPRVRVFRAGAVAGVSTGHAPQCVQGMRLFRAGAVAGVSAGDEALS